MATLQRDMAFVTFDQEPDAPLLPQEVMPQEFAATPSRDLSPSAWVWGPCTRRRLH